MNVKADLDAKVIEILGPDHEVSQMIEADVHDLEIIDVLLATFSALLVRIEELEKRKIH